MRRLTGSNFLFICLLIWPLLTRFHGLLLYLSCALIKDHYKCSAGWKCHSWTKNKGGSYSCADHCWRPLKCFVRFEISRISSSDVCRSSKLCFLTSAGHFNENFCKAKCRGVKSFHRKEKSLCFCEEEFCEGSSTRTHLFHFKAHWCYCMWLYSNKS